jgi:hypothetical protein
LEAFMKYRNNAIGLVALAGLFAGTTLLACGDKFLVAGRGARFQRGGARATSVLIYAPLSSSLRGGPGAQSVDGVLTRAGYHPGVAASMEEFGRLLREGAPGVVVVDIADAPAVAQYAPAAPAGPIILPVLKNASRQDVTAARKAYGVALKSPASDDNLLDAVDEAVDLRARSGKIAALTH